MVTRKDKIDIIAEQVMELDALYKENKCIRRLMAELKADNYTLLKENITLHDWFNKRGMK